ncbi:MAG: methylated-DNA--[Peptococcaceae bacterium]|nr:methylated-DNA--[protein]-cysteine S-methyltransferase [Peptococcaceae bacterium]
MKYYQDITVAAGWILRVMEADGSIMAVTILRQLEAGISDAICRETPLLLEAKRQLEEYFAGLRAAFSLPLAPEGTDFQKAVWRELENIPYGETRTYGQIARALGNPKASRAVGMANHKNPVAIMIPCHRVIGADGSLTGYAGGLDIKEALLRLEGAIQ